MYLTVQVVKLKFVTKFIKLIKTINRVCGRIRICNGCDVAVVRAHHSNITTVAYTIIVTYIYVHSLVELKIKK